MSGFCVAGDRPLVLDPVENAKYQRRVPEYLVKVSNTHLESNLELLVDSMRALRRILRLLLDW